MDTRIYFAIEFKIKQVPLPARRLQRITAGLMGRLLQTFTIEPGSLLGVAKITWQAENEDDTARSHDLKWLKQDTVDRLEVFNHQALTDQHGREEISFAFRDKERE